MDRKSLRTPIADILLRENDNIALCFPIHIAHKPEYELYFFRVMRRYPLHRTYDEEMSPISPGGTVDPDYVGDAGIGTGTDVFKISGERPFRIYHFGIGMRPQEVWMYKAIPAGIVQTGFAMELPPRVGDKRDYLSGSLSPYDQPTAATETVLYHNLSFHLGFRNDAAREIRPSIRFLGAGYDLTPISAVERMLAGSVPARFMTVGGLRSFDYTIPGPWRPYAQRVGVEKLGGILRG